jgi:hypothetical protein
MNRYRMDMRIKLKDPTICYLQETHLYMAVPYRDWKVNDRKWYTMQVKATKAGVAILMYNTINFKTNISQFF